MVARSLSLNDNDEITGLSRVFRQNRNILRATTGRPYEQIRKSNCSTKRNLSLRLSMPTAPLALPLPIDAHQALGSPSGRAGAKRLRGLTAPIPPTNYPQNHRTDSLYETAFLHELSAHPSPPPFGRYLSRRERQGAGCKLQTVLKTEI